MTTTDLGDIVTATLLVFGGIFLFIAALGIVRMPDLIMRMHAATKAGALGTVLVIVSVAVHYGELGMAARSLAAVVFILLTAPVAAHAIGRASYFVGIPLWKNTVMDELRGHYDLDTHGLDSKDVHPVPTERDHD